jgi:2-C-methyl-D-erythritol 4-phosphate cytidylyltransferase
MALQENQLLPFRMPLSVCVIIPAAGTSSRYAAAGGLRSKLDEDLGGKPLLQRTVETFTKFDDDDATISSIIVAGPHASADGGEAWREFSTRHTDRLSLLGAKVCQGGKTHRWETVHAALAMVPPACTHVAVHDAARPCVSFELLARVFRAAHKHDAVIPGINVPDTIKRVIDTDAPATDADPLAAILGDSPDAAKKPLRTVQATVDRAALVLVQTPQVFKADVLRRAYAQPDLSSTDDAGLVERLGVPVIVVEGDPRNIKVTVPHDVELARRILGLKDPEGRPVHKRF